MVMHSRLASAVEYVAYFSCEDREYSFFVATWSFFVLMLHKS